MTVRAWQATCRLSLTESDINTAEQSISQTAPNTRWSTVHEAPFIPSAAPISVHENANAERDRLGLWSHEVVSHHGAVGCNTLHYRYSMSLRLRQHTAISDS